MQTKLISQTGLKVRTNCRLGFFTFVGPLTEDQKNNNKCIRERDDRSLGCAFKLWSQDEWICSGDNNEQELARCMTTVWGSEKMKTYRYIYKPPQ